MSKESGAASLCSKSFTKKNSRLWIVVVTLARLIAARHVQAERALEIVLTVQVYPFRGMGCGMLLHSIEQCLGDTFTPELGSDIKALAFCRKSNRRQRAKYHAARRNIIHIRYPQARRCAGQVASDFLRRIPLGHANGIVVFIQQKLGVRYVGDRSTDYFHKNFQTVRMGIRLA